MTLTVYLSLQGIQAINDKIFKDDRYGYQRVLSHKKHNFIVSGSRHYLRTSRIVHAAALSCRGT